jgi:hypothetical protein
MEPARGNANPVRRSGRYTTLAEAPWLHEPFPHSRFTLPVPPSFILQVVVNIRQAFPFLPAFSKLPPIPVCR